MRMIGFAGAAAALVIAAALVAIARTGIGDFGMDDIDWYGMGG